MPFSYSEIPNNSPHSSLFLHSYLLSPNSIIVTKFKFKIQQYQTEAVENTVNVFEGQPAQQGQKGYRIDLGIELSATIRNHELNIMNYALNKSCHIIKRTFVRSLSELLSVQIFIK